MKYVSEVLFFKNGNIAAFDENGQTIQELQNESAIELWAKKAKLLGYNLKDCVLKVQANDIQSQMIGFQLN